MIFNSKGLLLFSIFLMLLAICRIFIELPMTLIFIVSATSAYLVVQDMLEFGVELEQKKMEHTGEVFTGSRFYAVARVLFYILGGIFIFGPIFYLIVFRSELFLLFDRPEKAIDVMSIMSLALVLLTIAVKEVLYSKANSTIGLTTRESEVLNMINMNKTNAQISRELGISKTRVNQLRKSIKSKGISL